MNYRLRTNLQPEIATAQAPRNDMAKRFHLSLRAEERGVAISYRNYQVCTNLFVCTVRPIIVGLFVPVQIAAEGQFLLMPIDRLEITLYTKTKFQNGVAKLSFGCRG